MVDFYDTVWTELFEPMRNNQTVSNCELERLNAYTSAYQDCAFDLDNMTVSMKSCGQLSVSGKTSSSFCEDHSKA